jgi:hypothetical protein
MASVELARKCSEVSTDGEQGKAADGNQGKGTDGKQCNFVFLNPLRKGFLLICSIRFISASLLINSCLFPFIENELWILYFYVMH